jgi:hypothetical protein
MLWDGFYDMLMICRLCLGCMDGCIYFFVPFQFHLLCLDICVRLWMDNAEIHVYDMIIKCYAYA